MAHAYHLSEFVTKDGVRALAYWGEVLPDDENARWDFLESGDLQRVVSLLGDEEAPFLLRGLAGTSMRLEGVARRRCITHRARASQPAPLEIACHSMPSRRPSGPIQRAAAASSIASLPWWHLPMVMRMGTPSWLDFIATLPSVNL